MPERRQHYSIWSSGVDETLQGVGGDPWGGYNATGLRIPTNASAVAQPNQRYLFMLGGLWLPEGCVARVIGLRQLLTLGTIQQGQLIEMAVEQPSFHLADSNVSWHMTLVPPRMYDTIIADAQPAQAAAGVENLAFRITDVPALVYETITPGAFYFNLAAYTAPNGGKPWGQPLVSLTNRSDLFSQWNSNQAMHPLTWPVEGPGFLGAWASVAQTAGFNFTAPTDAGALPKEWRFIAAYGNAVKLWRVGIQMDVEVLGVTDVGGGPPQVGSGPELVGGSR